jgi:iron complex outermembrane receptor protein
MVNVTRTTATVIACAVCWVAAVAQAQDSQKITIPPGDLNVALESLVKQTGVQLLYDVKQVEGLRTPGVSEAASPQAAVDALLKGTALTIKTDASGAILIAAPLSKRVTAMAEDTDAARLRLAQAGREATPTTGGRTADQAARDRSGVAPSVDISTFTLDEIIVTGSRLKRLEVEGPSPVVVITREEIERSGATTAREVLNTVTQNAVSRDESGLGTFLGASTVQLRGLPLGTTLMLINGRRVGSSGPTVSANLFDLNNIPLGAIERIEVLTDSASAIYGADAVGGAVNLILRNDFTGAGASVRFGRSSEGDADERNAALTFGGKGESFSGLVVLDFFDRDPLRGKDRKLGSTWDLSRLGAGGTDFRESTAYPANLYGFDPDTFEFAPLPGLTTPLAASPPGTDGVGLTPADFAASDGTHSLFDPGPYQTLQAEAKRKSVFASGRYVAASAVELFAEALYTHRDQIIEFAPQPVSFATVPASNPFNPFGVDVWADYRLLELGPRAYEQTSEFSRFLVGASGPLGQHFDWQVYALADEDASDLFNRGVADAATLQSFLDSTDPSVALNVFSTTGNNNPQTLAALRAAGESTDELSTRSRMAEAVLRGALFNVPAGPVSMVLGLNARHERVDYLRGSENITLRDERDIKAAFAELSLPLVGAAQGIPAVHSLELTAAIRHDDNSDFESSTNPQFGVMWRPVPSLLLRSSYGEAFKAPSAFHLGLLPLTLPFAALDPLRGDTPSPFLLRLGGNRDLKPETGKAWSAGLVWEPAFAPGFSAMLSGFRVEQEDFITVVLPDVILANEDLFPGRVVRAPVDPSDPTGFAGQIISVDSSFANFGRLTVKGADGQLKYAFPRTTYGEFAASLGATYIDEYEIFVTPGVAPSNEVNQANAAGYPVRLKGNAGVNWSSSSGWSAGMIARYLNSYTDYDGMRELPSQTWLDVQVGRRFDNLPLLSLDNVEATLGVTNLTDNQGDFSNNFGYDFVQSDIRGRFFYVSLKARF